MNRLMVAGVCLLLAASFAAADWDPIESQNALSSDAGHERLGCAGHVLRRSGR